MPTVELTAGTIDYRDTGGTALCWCCWAAS